MSSLLHLQGFHDFIDEMLPHESPVHYGLHPNAEIEFLTVTSDNLFHTLLELQSPDAVMGDGPSQTLEEKVASPTSSVILRPSKHTEILAHNFWAPEKLFQ